MELFPLSRLIIEHSPRKIVHIEPHSDDPFFDDTDMLYFIHTPKSEQSHGEYLDVSNDCFVMHSSAFLYGGHPTQKMFCGNSEREVLDQVISYLNGIDQARINREHSQD